MGGKYKVTGREPLKGAEPTREALSAAAYEMATLRGMSVSAIAKILGRSKPTISKYITEHHELVKKGLPIDLVEEKLKKLIPQAVDGIEYHIRNTKSRDNYRACEKLLETYGYLGREEDESFRRRSDSEIVRDIVKIVAAISVEPTYPGLAGGEDSS